MPKKLDHIRDKAITCTRQILITQGYDALTMRTIAQSCGIAVGTMYNYFPSKEYLTGCVVLEDWLQAYSQMQELASGADTVDQGLEQIYGKMLLFVQDHQYLTAFDQRKATGEYAYADRHILLRGQIQELLELLLGRFDIAAEPQIILFLAESILNCSTKQFHYSQLAAAFSRLLG